jgi:pyruvate dehydrogenase E2 component (dihydrolipoamide acetyltransferase)
MMIVVTMPILGLTMEQGTIVAWLKEVGDRVAVGEPLFLVETDKATSDAPSPATGILARIAAPEGETVAVGETIAFIAETEADLTSEMEVPAGAHLPPTTDASQPPAAGTGEGTPAVAGPGPAVATGPEAPAVAGPPRPERIFASPRARARARESGLDLKAIPHQGERIMAHDVQAVAGVKPLSRARRITAERMTLSATTIPQVTYSMRCDVTEAMDLRRALKAEAAKRGVSLPLDAFIVRAAARALIEHPQVNSEWVEGLGIRPHAQVNVAVAVDVEDRGLMIPVVHDAGSLGLWETAAELDRLVAGVRAAKLGPDDYAGATFTITSLAVSGVETFDPIIVPPQAAILGVGAIVTTPVFVRDEVVKRRLLSLCLTTDHRLLDGTPSARFLSRVRELLERPAGLL